MNWKSIKGYEGLYEVSDTGLVRSLKYGKKRILRTGKNNKGYYLVVLCRNGICKTMLVHRLVAEAFIPNPMNLPVVNHRDEVKTNNDVANLEWMTQADNLRYSISQPVLQLDQFGNVVNQFPSMAEAERQTGIDQSIISMACRNGFPVCGYVWKFA